MVNFKKIGVGIGILVILTVLIQGDFALSKAKTHKDSSKKKVDELRLYIEKTRKKIKFIKELKEKKSKHNIKTLANLLKKECKKPKSGKRWSTRPEEEFFKKFLIFALKNMGKDAIGIVEEYKKRATGDFLRRLIITTGFLGETKDYDTIARYLAIEQNPHIRELAAFALGYMGDKKAVPLLERALRDRFYLDMSKADPGHDILIPPPYNKNYIVREAALHSLKELGVKIKRKGWNIWIEK